MQSKTSSQRFTNNSIFVYNPNMIRNQSGHIAMRWVIERRNPPLVKIDGTERVYTFSPKSNIFLAWVEPDDAERLLVTKAKTCNCSGGTYQIAFGYATRLDVMLYETGSRDGLLNPEYKEN